MEKSSRKSKKKVEAPLILKSDLEDGCKGALFISQSTILIAEGAGTLSIYDYESSKTILSFVPSPEKTITTDSSEELTLPKKIIFGLHITSDLIDSSSGNIYKVLIILYKDGMIDGFTLTKNDKVMISEGAKPVFSVKSPICMMMQVPKLDLIFSSEILKGVTDPENSSIQKDDIQKFFAGISNLDKSKKNGQINIINIFNINSHTLILIGYECGSITLIRYLTTTTPITPTTTTATTTTTSTLTTAYATTPIISSTTPTTTPTTPTATTSTTPTPTTTTTTSPVQGLHSNYQVVSLCADPPIITGLMVEHTQSIINVYVGTYTNYVTVLEIDISTIEEAGFKNAKAKKPIGEIVPVTVIHDIGFKPGTFGMVSVPQYQCILTGSGDYRVRLYRIKNLTKPRLVGLFKHHKGMINSLISRFSGDTGELLVASEDGSVSLWTLPF